MATIRPILTALMTLAAGAACAEPVTIETARGPVTLEAEPARVVVLDMAALDTIDALGVAPAGVPARLFLPYLAHVTAAPVGTLQEPDFEAIAALAPELIIAGGRSSAQVAALGAIAPTIDMTIAGDRLVGDALARIEGYGALFGRAAEAERLAGEIETALAAAREAVAGAGPALILMTNGPKVSAYGPGSRFGWLHSDLGLAPAVADLQTSRHGEAISFEFIHTANPDWLVVVDRAAAIGEAGGAARQTLDNPLVAGTTAWTEGNLVFLDPTSIYIADGGARSLTGILDQIADAFGR